jgi:hypothetical protein
VTLAVVLAGVRGGDAVAECVEVPFHIVRYEEDYTSYRSPECRESPLDAIKHIPLGESPSSFLSVGGQLRLRYEYFDDATLGLGDQDDNGYLLSRAYAHAELRLSKTWRGFVQLRSAFASGREGGPRPLDEDELDIHQAFVEARAEVTGGDVYLRLGRQEAARDFRLVGLREWPNVRLAFDGVRVDSRFGPWHAAGYFAKSVTANPELFDDFETEPLQLVWGVHGVRVFDSRLAGGASAFYVGYRADDATYRMVTADEQRHVIGGHVWSPAGRPFDYEIEGTLQLGSHGDDDILAWLFAANLGRRFAIEPASVRAGALLEVGSGDSDPADGTLETFNAFYPANRYFGKTGLIGAYANAYHLRASLDASLPRSVTAGVSANFYWRQSTGDDVYNPGRFPLIASEMTSGRFIGSQLSADVSWIYSRHLDFNAVYAHFQGGAVVRNAGLATTVDYLALQARTRF